MPVNNLCFKRSWQESPIPCRHVPTHPGRPANGQQGDAMIHTVWPYLAVMLLVAGLFPAMERRFGWTVFSVLPPIVLTYLLVTALAVSGLWQDRKRTRLNSSH